MLFVVLFTFALFFFSPRFSAKVAEYVRFSRELEELTRQEAALQAEIARLTKERRYLEEDWYIEELAREKLKLVKPGEILVQVVKPGEE
ncbi:septum formation initiator family protein [Candidatus Caldatribacterium sp.]|uniref:FtsB family cell division protein n=1 Tax=Candidatus Caldatribacterium sp. TaxID=2282143 RepID=UPI00299B131E|nr:septum formation initiator family protein [Candidatus Caldatribacterium sp.]MDW8081310.1 septum formation initiator family protein [Candidatus Calescibacterium sp.]